MGCATWSMWVVFMFAVCVVRHVATLLFAMLALATYSPEDLIDNQNVVTAVVFVVVNDIASTAFVAVDLGCVAYERGVMNDCWNDSIVSALSSVSVLLAVIWLISWVILATHITHFAAVLIAALVLHTASRMMLYDWWSNMRFTVSHHLQCESERSAGGRRHVWLSVSTSVTGRRAITVYSPDSAAESIDVTTSPPQ